MKIVKTVLGNHFKLPNPGLNSFLDRTERGQPDDYRTPFWNKAPREEVLAKWTEVVDAIDVDSVMPGLKQIEWEQKGKVGPLSIMKPFEQRIEDVKSYYTLIKDDVKPIPREAIKLMKSELRKGSLSLKSYENVLEDMKLSTNSGSPYFAKRRLVTQQTLDDIKSGRTAYELAAILGWRGQAGGIQDEDVKQRVVWMFPFEYNIEELRFYQPMISAWQTDSTYPALISLRAVEEQMTRLFDTKGDDPVICTDFSKFDQHINQELQNLAEELILYQFNRKDHEQIKNVFPIKYNIPLVCTKDVTFTGKHGMGSGSGGTNADENLQHRTLQHTAAHENGAQLNPYSMCLGDDGLLSYPGITVEQVMSAYTSRGLEMNADKQYVDKHSAYFLQRYYHTEYRDNTGVMLGVYSTFRALGRLLGQERYYDPEKWNDKLVTLRAWSILENCKNSPLFERFVDFVYEGDKYGLGTKIPGFFNDLDREVEEARDAIPDLFGYSQGMEYEGTSIGIRDWSVYKYLKRKYMEGVSPIQSVN